jgi:hypothetical protein
VIRTGEYQRSTKSLGSILSKYSLLLPDGQPPPDLNTNLSTKPGGAGVPGWSGSIDVHTPLYFSFSSMIDVNASSVSITYFASKRV